MTYLQAYLETMAELLDWKPVSEAVKEAGGVGVPGELIDTASCFSDNVGGVAGRQCAVVDQFVEQSGQKRAAGHSPAKR